ncbi:MAG: tRNA (guanosine(46)-N7)-methyltransferase TrmB [Sarcina sp.]|uniref:tRNA (guanosine(46)-N7)-methyltransferase TrmB n=1 Tax=Sarcina sp. DSM 11001 TaxID=1798184 RepID=UPI000883852F|nr:tRNA (guanosine(46)-N7)-methyltransferase TrmB [Sarcina sp. DSM 11001]MBE6000945.1 tRNA (guanosine(46)-N7)-methyltransferase TrmB [Sarcina sp.]MEE1040511.1 tRNA (guanosine(46)-N7)-methyltransferase TrmB [Lachnospiraceae bacterium]MDO5485180.1 tRNA (guanosine(46)-N7)-methyltransferase TrmB [Sarcina sp.]SDL43003.1 tRNA (guanine-N7-)-methyltransferase [Sarcina sp. DSM 11001]HAL59051.1 tRNA (guanosine(46)-N7)-methyltransferase TrmB [Sarcina sp.]
MRLRNIPGARDAIAASPWVIQKPEKHCGHWKSVFGNEKPLHLEIGTGKGRFIMQLAQEHPEINYIGIEKYSSVLLRCLEKQEELQLQNLIFIRGDAELINTFFTEGEIEKIYLNFSDPWPKERHARRRLPSSDYLRRYDRILAQGGTIEFKTDNRGLFDFAVDETAQSAFEIAQITYDLHNDPVMNIGNIMTEYEEKFSKKGNKICKYILRRREDKEDRKDNSGS